MSCKSYTILDQIITYSFVLQTTVTNTEQDDTTCRLTSFLSQEMPDPETMNVYVLNTFS